MIRTPIEINLEHAKSDHTEKLAYQTPKLIAYGDIADLTASGSGAVIEAFVGQGMSMVCVTVVSNRACP